MNTRSPFYICKLEKAYLNHTESGTVMEVFLKRKDFFDGQPVDDKGMSKDPWIKSLTARKNPSKSFLDKQIRLFKKGKDVEIANHKNPIRWLGSGAMLIIELPHEVRYVVLNKRNPKYAWGGYYDINGGYSSSVKDMLSPKDVALRELSEEVFIKKGGKKVPLETKNLKVIRPKNSTSVVVNYNNKKYITKNLILIIDRETGTVDFRQIFKIKLENFHNFDITNYEDMFINTKDIVLEKSPTFLVNLRELLDVNYKDSQIPKGLRTPALKTVLKNINYEFI